MKTHLNITDKNIDLCSYISKINGKNVRHIFVPYFSEEEQNIIKNFELAKILSSKNGSILRENLINFETNQLDKITDNKDITNYLYNSILKLGNDFAQCLKTIPDKISVTLIIKDADSSTKEWHVDPGRDGIILALTFTGNSTLFPVNHSEDLYIVHPENPHPMGWKISAYTSVKSSMIKTVKAANFGELSIFSMGFKHGAAHRSPDVSEPRLTVLFAYNFMDDFYFDNTLNTTVFDLETKSDF